MKEMVSFELGKETEKDVFRLVTLVTLLSQKTSFSRGLCSYNSNTFLAER